MTNRKWLKGALATVIASAANAINGMLVLPSVFNFSHSGLANSAKMICIPTAGALTYYFMKSPLADVTATIDEKGRVTEVDGSIDVEVKSPTKNA